MLTLSNPMLSKYLFGEIKIIYVIILPSKE